MRTTFVHEPADPDRFKTKLLAWAQQFREVAFLDSNSYLQQYSSFDFALAADAFTSLQTGEQGAFDELSAYQQQTRDWLFGYFSYDLKNDIEKLSSKNPDRLDTSPLFFFQPKKLFIFVGGKCDVHYLHHCADEIQRDLLEIENFDDPSGQTSPIAVNAVVSRDRYLEKVAAMKRHLNLGDIYEANFCIEFFAENATIDPLETFRKLNAISTPPFAAYFKKHRDFLLSASPERYLRKQSGKVISQPIKGTARRDDDLDKDSAIAIALESNEKERAENIMIVDLVRNDLSRTAQRDSVKVEKLCEVQTFRQVHHLVSTIVSNVDSTVSPVEIVRTTFPMGSMTGAPKISAMQIIDTLEDSKRGLYSGSIGYFTPDGDFDFNVVIRSVLYNSDKKIVSYSVGSAITALSDPEGEYLECMLKAEAMKRVLAE